MLFKGDGKQLIHGDILKRPELAATLRRISIEGADTFYNGSLMRTMVEELAIAGAILTEEDFSTYRVKSYPALKVNMTEQNMTMFGVRPPGSGAILGFILNVMSGYNDLYPKATLTEQGAGIFYHRLIETFKYAYAKRMLLGDEAFDDVKQVVDSLTNDEFAKKTRAKIKDDKTFPQDYCATIYAIKDDHGIATPSRVNKFAPKQRPLSRMCPPIIL